MEIEATIFTPLQLCLVLLSRYGLKTSYRLQSPSPHVVHHTGGCLLRDICVVDLSAANVTMSLLLLRSSSRPPAAERLTRWSGHRPTTQHWPSGQVCSGQLVLVWLGDRSLWGARLRRRFGIRHSARKKPFSGVSLSHSLYRMANYIYITGLLYRVHCIAVYQWQIQTRKGARSGLPCLKFYPV